jgi:hypothetical protein
MVALLSLSLVIGILFFQQWLRTRLGIQGIVVHARLQEAGWRKDWENRARRFSQAHFLVTRRLTAELSNDGKGWQSRVTELISQLRQLESEASDEDLGLDSGRLGVVLSCPLAIAWPLGSHFRKYAKLTVYQEARRGEGIFRAAFFRAVVLAGREEERRRRRLRRFTVDRIELKEEEGPQFLVLSAGNEGVRTAAIARATTLGCKSGRIVELRDRVIRERHYAFARVYSELAQATEAALDDPAFTSSGAQRRHPVYLFMSMPVALAFALGAKFGHRIDVRLVSNLTGGRFMPVVTFPLQERRPRSAP